MSFPSSLYSHPGFIFSLLRIRFETIAIDAYSSDRKLVHVMEQVKIPQHILDEYEEPELDVSFRFFFLSFFVS